MLEMTWDSLEKVYDHIQVEMMKTAPEAIEIPAEFVQESVGAKIPFEYGKLSEVQFLVPKEKTKEAQLWLDEFDN